MTYETTPPHSFLLQWHLTERCDRRCAHCYQDQNPSQEMEWSQLLDVLNQFKAMVGQWRRQRNHFSAQITVTGGEPYLREDFPRFLELLAASRESCSFAVLCNGGGIDRAAARHLARLNPRFVQVSVDGTPQHHDALRGRNDFVRVERAVKELKQAGVNTLVSFTAHPSNANDFTKVARWAWRNGVDRLWTDRLLPLGAASRWQGENFTPSETALFFATVRRAKEVWWRRLLPHGEIVMNRALQFLVGGGQPYRCLAGDRLLALMPDGTVFPCRRLPRPVGQVFDNGGLKRIYEEQDLLRRLRHPATIPDNCRSCFYACLCRGGARCMSAAILGDPFARDPGCWQRFD
ncbi:MAG: radical SAM protein [Magnetococcales bacterium]|nr:radical SAM protein [Magnetococcales bacterium]MBF0437515.1 radical SAM protein [Magnetococcales bacterium]